MRCKVFYVRVFLYSICIASTSIICKIVYLFINTPGCPATGIRQFSVVVVFSAIAPESMGVVFALFEVIVVWSVLFEPESMKVVH